MKISKLKLLSATDILAIDTPEALFTQREYPEQLRVLRKMWHPDVNTESLANDVFVHITQLSTEAKLKLLNGDWNGNAEITFTTESDKTYVFRYNSMHVFELGKCYIGDTKLVYVVDNPNTDLFVNAVTQISNITYPTDAFKSQFSLLLPNIILQDKNTTIGNVLVIDKPSDVVLLSDLISERTAIDPIHVAWMCGAMMNVATFMDHIGICHNAMLPSNIFVNTKQHSMHLLGGWWYSSRVNTPMIALPNEAINILPKSALIDKTSKTMYDRQIIRTTVTNCLGDPSGTGSALLMNKTIPKQFIQWTRAHSHQSAIQDIADWDEMLISVYGKRKFVEFV